MRNAQRQEVEHDVHPTVVDRYYTKKYFTDVNKKAGEDQCIMIHSNRLCLVTLADSHPILRDGKTVSLVDFQVSDRLNRLQNKTSGKGKKGAQMLDKQSILCHVTCTDQSVYSLRSCIKGSLVEVNDQLVGRPGYLVSHPDSFGYIAVVLTRLGGHDAEIRRLLTETQYREVLAARDASVNTDATAVNHTELTAANHTGPTAVNHEEPTGANHGEPTAANHGEPTAVNHGEQTSSNQSDNGCQSD